jgi:hypothetical protein
MQSAKWKVQSAKCKVQSGKCKMENDQGAVSLMCRRQVPG